MKMLKTALHMQKCFLGFRHYVTRNRLQLIRSRCLATEAKPLNTIDDEYSRAKPLSAMPGPFTLSYVTTIFGLIFMSDNWHEALFRKFARYGPIFKEDFGNLLMIFTCDLDAVEKLHRLEGKYPRRITLESWRTWKAEQDLSRGILTEDGPDWKRMRVLLDKHLLQPRHVATYTDGFNEVISDLIERLKRIKSRGNGKSVPNIDQELFHWSLETIGTVLYEARLGGLLENRSLETTRYVKAVQDLFTSTAKVAFIPKKLNLIFLRKWQILHDNCWDIIFRTSKKLVDSKFKEIQEKAEKGEEVSGFLPYLLAAEMNREEVYANISEIMLGAVDTTSNTMQWVLYELSRDSNLQDRLHIEITRVVPPGKIPTYDDLQKMPLLKATIKESLRMYPIAVSSSRLLNNNMVLCGYQIPADVTVIVATYNMSRDPKKFMDPLTFKPERWLRNENSEEIHSFSWLPFGFGPRSCIGRRVAELEMHLLLCRILQQFTVEPADNEIRRPIVRGLLVPHKPVGINFLDRS